MRKTSLANKILSFVAFLFICFNVYAVADCDTYLSPYTYNFPSNESLVNCGGLSGDQWLMVTNPDTSDGESRVDILQTIFNDSGQMASRYRDMNLDWSDWSSATDPANFWTTATGSSNNILTGIQNRYGSASFSSVESASNSSPITVTYGAPCSTAAYSVTLSVLESSAGIAMSSKILSQTASGFSAIVSNLSNTASQAGTLYYNTTCH